ncbi:MAG: PepSY domain-containing protein, partial [Lysobacterales bacterium]
MSSTVTSDGVADAELRAAARIRTRRVLARIHLWIALGLGLYIVVLSVSGSAIVFRRELNTWVVPRTVESTEGLRLTGAELEAAVRVAYPGQSVIEVREPQRPERPVFVILERTDAVRTERLFDPFAARDLGETFP